MVFVSKIHDAKLFKLTSDEDFVLKIKGLKIKKVCYSISSMAINNL